MLVSGDAIYMYMYVLYIYIYIYSTCICWLVSLHVSQWGVYTMYIIL